MIYFEIDTASFNQVYQSIGSTKDKTQQILKSAINDTATQTVKMLVDAAREKYVIKKPTSVRKTMTVTKAKVNRLEATIRSNGHVNELYSFSVKPRAYTPQNRPKSGHKGRVVTDNVGKYLRYTPGSKDKHKAFTVKFASGHISVAQRIPDSHRGEPNKYGHIAEPRPGHPDEEAIKTLPSPSVPKLLEGVWGGELSDSLVSSHISPQVYKMLQSNISKQLERYMKLK